MQELFVVISFRRDPFATTIEPPPYESPVYEHGKEAF